MREIGSEEDSDEPQPPRKKRRVSRKKAAVGCARIEQYDPSTQLGKLRQSAALKNVVISKTMFKKINAEVKISAPEGSKPKKKIKKKKKKPKNTLANYGFFKPKPRPGAT